MAVKPACPTPANANTGTLAWELPAFPLWASALFRILFVEQRLIVSINFTSSSLKTLYLPSL